MRLFSDTACEFDHKVCLSYVQSQDAVLIIYFELVFGTGEG